MAIDNPPAYLQSEAYSASRDRLHKVTAHVTRSLDIAGHNARNGIFRPSTQTGSFSNPSGWDVVVAKFMGVVTNTFAAEAGDYQVINTETQTLTLTASSPTTNRIDIIGVRVQDAFYSGSANQADLVVVEGDAVAGTPTIPTLPASFMPMIMCTVNANSTAPDLTDVRRSISAIGGVGVTFPWEATNPGLPVGEMQLLPASGTYGQRLRVWDGSEWHGLMSHVLPHIPQANGSTGIGGGGSLMVLTRNVPDPGYSYRITAASSVAWQMVNANQSATVVSTITLDGATWDTNTMAYGYFLAVPQTVANSNQTSAMLPPRVTDPLTGAHTLRVFVRIYGQTVAIPFDPTTALYVRVDPA